MTRRMKHIPMTEELKIDGEMRPTHEAILLAHDANRTLICGMDLAPPTFDLLYRLGGMYFVETRAVYDEHDKRVPVTARLVPTNKAIAEYRQYLDPVVPADIAFPDTDITPRTEEYQSPKEKLMASIGRPE